MRVTNMLKDIITDKVYAILNPKIDAKSEELNELTREREKIKNKYVDEFDSVLAAAVKAAIQTFQKKHKDIEVAYHYKEYYRNDPPVVERNINKLSKKMSIRTWDYIQSDLDKVVKVETELAELKRMKDSLPNEIILELELGASKADFEDILAKHLAGIQEL